VEEVLGSKRTEGKIWGDVDYCSLLNSVKYLKMKKQVKH